MNRQETIVNKDKSKMSLVPKLVYGIRTDVPQNIQYFAWDKCAYAAGNYIVVYSIRDKAQYFFPAHPHYGQITCFTADENADTIVLVIAQKPMILFIRLINKNTFQETDSKIIEATDAESVYEYYTSLSVNASKGILLALSGPKTPSTVRIFQDELRGSKRANSTIKMTTQTAYKNVCINCFNPYYMAVYGDGGFAILQMNDMDKKTITKIEVDPRSTQYAEFSSFLFSFVACTWITKNRVAILNVSSDVFVIEFYNKNKLENVYKKVIKCFNIFEAQAKGKGIFMKNGNLFVCKDDGIIVKLEDKQQIEKNIIYEKIQRNTKFIQNMPKMDVHSLSLNNPLNSSTTFHAIMLTSNSGQIYYIDITNENVLSDGSNYKYLLSPFHTDEILCLDVSKLKPLIVTCTADRNINIWNYVTNQLEISECFEEDPLNVAFHPNGLHIGVLFKDKFQLMNLLEKKLIVSRELILYQPSDLKFSNYGNFFSICYKNIFQIYNFFTCEVIFSSKHCESIQIHTDEVKCLTWDTEENGFATCGLDGRSFYWRLYSKEPQVIEFYNKDFRLIGVDIYTNKETNLKKLFILDQRNLLEIDQPLIETDESKKEKEANEDLNFRDHKPATILSNLNFSQCFYDADSKLIIFSTDDENAPSLHLSSYPFILEKKEFTSFQAHATGVKCMKPSHDMKYLITGSRDKCMFFFEITNAARIERREDSLVANDLILVKKEDLDKESLELRTRLNKIDSEINKEVEQFDNKSKEIENEIQDCIQEEIREKEKFQNDVTELNLNRVTQIQTYEDQLQEMLDEHNNNLDTLKTEHLKNREIKEKEKEKEVECLKNEKNKDEAHSRLVKKTNEQEITHTKENYNTIIANLNSEIFLLKEKCDKVSNLIEKDKSDRIEINDNAISIKRLQLESMKKDYEKIKFEHAKFEEKIKNEIWEIKATIKQEEAKKVENRNQLSAIHGENTKLVKHITELNNDKREKEETVMEKNSVRKELEKENQELEKFKFVLNYKIKELKLEKDPKENKLANLEKQAKDMEKEIKNFEFSQANYIVDLSTNHEIMKLHEKQIAVSEKNIDRFKNYIKLFQEALYDSMKRPKNHKELKKELVKLKELFLDKEFIENLDKPYEFDYEFQRQFLENAISDYKSKLENGRFLLSQDFQKIMRENKKLLTIVNELEKEKKEIEAISFHHYNLSKSSNVIKPSMNIKTTLPFILRTSDNSEHKINRMKRELFELEKEILFAKELKKKEDTKKEHKKRNSLSVSRSIEKV